MEPDIPEILRSTAQNMSELFHVLANRVEELEKENERLKHELEARGAKVE